MIGYVTIGALDLDKAVAFYDAVFETIGGERKSFDGTWGFYGRTARAISASASRTTASRPAAATAS